MASRSETKRGEWAQFESANFKVRPMGSVAYKLALVSAGLVDITEIPAECGLVDAGFATADEWKRLICRHAGFFAVGPDTGITA